MISRYLRNLILLLVLSTIGIGIEVKVGGSFSTRPVIASSFHTSSSNYIDTLLASNSTPIDFKYAQLGGENSFLGTPKSPEQSTSDGIGRFREYQNGVIYWRPDTGAHEVHGDILTRWSQLGREQSALGYPTSDEENAPDGGRISYFKRGSIHWQLHSSPLTFYQQNMALLVFPASYNGTERDEAVTALITNLATQQPDIVGLSELFADGEREQIKSSLINVYPFSIEGPDEADVESDGGLLLLSKYPIIESHQTIYRQCYFVDCSANKGVLHARIEVPGHPAPYDIFLSHVQAPYSSSTGRSVLQAQLLHLNTFIQAYRSPHRPALLMGDLNTDSYNGNCADNSEPYIYEDMMYRLQYPRDLWAEEGLESNSNPCIGVTSDSEGAFEDGDGPKSVDDPSRHQHGERIDYFFVWQDNQYWPTFQDTEKIIWQSSPGWDISDHYGLWTNQTYLRELTVDLDLPVESVSITLSGFHCLQETDEVGDDEVYFNILADSPNGAIAQDQTGVTEGVATGDFHTYNDPISFTLGNPGDWLDITIDGWEEDSSDDDSLGRTSIRLEQSDLLDLLAKADNLGHTTKRVLPILDGGGGEYAVFVTITLEPPSIPDKLLADTSLIILDPENNVDAVTRLVFNDNPSSSIPWNASVSEPWLNLTPTSSRTPGEFTVAFVNPGLSQGKHTALVTITGPSVPNQSLEIPVEVNVPAYKLYLPFIDNNSAPDLIIEEIVISDENVTITIVNKGTQPATSPFWVDLYVNPYPIPTGVNQIWSDGRSQYGLVWGITSDIPINGSITLTIDDPYYWASLSHWPNSLPEDTPIYAQVDSTNIETTWGGVLEQHEISGTPYNNINGPVYPTSATSLFIPIGEIDNTTYEAENKADELPLRTR